jgi:hypothetical protein
VVENQESPLISEERQAVLTAMRGHMRHARTSGDFAPLKKFIRKQVVTISFNDLKWFLKGDVYPNWFLSSLVQLVKGRTINRMLNPMDDYGLVSVPLATAIKPQSATGLLPPHLFQDLLSVFKDSPVVWRNLTHLTEDLEWLTNHNDQYDLIVSVPQLGWPMSPDNRYLRPHPADLFQFEHLSYDDVVMANACLKLSHDGIGLFVLSDWLFSSHSQFREKLAEQGLFVNAVFRLPASKAYRAENRNLILVSRENTETLFIAELTENENHNDRVIKQMRKRKESRDPVLGQFVSHAEFRSIDVTVESAKLKKQAYQLGLRPVVLSDIAHRIQLIEARQEFDHQPNTIYIPLYDIQQVATLPNPSKSQDYDYWQIELQPDQALAEYVVRLLKMRLGQMMLRVFSRDRSARYVRDTGMGDMVLFLPEPQIQRDIVETDHQVDSLIQHLSELKEELWSTPQQDSIAVQKIQEFVGEELAQRERFEDWIDTLPFPIASILWAYHATNDPFKKYRLLQRYFEALTQFIATVLLSGFYNADDWLATHSTLFNIYQKNLKTPTFGTWRRIAETLISDLHRHIQIEKERLTDGELAGRQRCEQLFATRADVLARLFPRSLIAVFSDTNFLRNEWRGHGGADDRVAPERLLELEAHLNTTREILGRFWTEYRLIKPDSSRKVAGKFKQGVQLLMGHHNPFVTITLELDEPLDTSSLYLHSSGQQYCLKLQPLIHILEKLAGEENAAYFFSQIKGAGVMFISHHYEKEPEILEPFTETLTFLEDLKNRSSDRDIDDK